MVDHAAVAKNTQFVVDELLSLLGWDVKDQVPFSPSFEPLGVVVDLSDSHSGQVRISNKQSRVEDLRCLVASVEASGSISAQEAQQFRGRFIFSRSQIFGRVGAPALRLLGAVADGRGSRRCDARPLILALRRLLDVLSCSPPRLLRASLPPAVVIFVDGACEPGAVLPAVGLGACMFDTADGTAEFFGTDADAGLVRLWADRPDAQVIAQAELVPTLMAASTWKDRLSGRPALIFIDNDSARFGLISGYSPVLASAALISAAWGLLASLGTAAWFGRVPTACNPADGPSRGKLRELLEAGAVRVEPSFNDLKGAEMWKVLAQHLVDEIPR